MKKVTFVLLLVLLFTSCQVINQVGGAIQLSQCEYRYHSLEDIQLAGLNLGDGSNISLSQFASISSILSGRNLQTIPLSMILKMDVKNPNQSAAFLNALDYSIEINDMELTTGKMDIPLRVEGGQSTILPISVGVDLKNLINRYSRERVSKEMSSFLGLTNDPTKITVKLWPKVMVGKTALKVPAPIPVVFKFGGSEERK